MRGQPPELLPRGCECLPKGRQSECESLRMMRIHFTDKYLPPYNCTEKLLLVLTVFAIPNVNGATVFTGSQHLGEGWRWCRCTQGFMYSLIAPRFSRLGSLFSSLSGSLSFPAHMSAPPPHTDGAITHTHRGTRSTPLISTPHPTPATHRSNRSHPQRHTTQHETPGNRDS